MKRFFVTAAAVLCITAAVTACGNNDKGETASAESSASETQAESTEAAETAESETEADGIQQTSVDGLHVKISSDDRSTSSEDGETTLTGTFEEMSIEDDGYDKLKKAVSAADASAKESYEENWVDSQEFLGEASDEDQEWTLNNYIVLSRCDDDVFSYTRTDDSYLGGAHPNSYIVSYNFDSDTGAELSLQDVVTDYDEVYQYVLNDLARQNDEQNGELLFDDYTDTVDKLFNGTEADANDTDAADSYTEDAKIQWIMADDRIYVVFNRYDIAPYAAGQISVEIPVSSGLLSPDYFVQE